MPNGWESVSIASIKPVGLGIRGFTNIGTSRTAAPSQLRESSKRAEMHTPLRHGGNSARTLLAQPQYGHAH